MALAVEGGAVRAIGGLKLEAGRLTESDRLTERKARVLCGLGGPRIKDQPHGAHAATALDVARYDVMTRGRGPQVDP